MGIRKSNGRIQQVEFKAQTTPRLRPWKAKKPVESAAKTLEYSKSAGEENGRI